MLIHDKMYRLFLIINTTYDVRLAGRTRTRGTSLNIITEDGGAEETGRGSTTEERRREAQEGRRN